jgi:hypothetical protein
MLFDAKSEENTVQKAKKEAIRTTFIFWIVGIRLVLFNRR